VAYDTWLRSTIIPSRFISAITVWTEEHSHCNCIRFDYCPWSVQTIDNLVIWTPVCGSCWKEALLPIPLKKVNLSQVPLIVWIQQAWNSGAQRLHTYNSREIICQRHRGSHDTLSAWIQNLSENFDNVSFLGFGNWKVISQEYFAQFTPLRMLLLKTLRTSTHLWWTDPLVTRIFQEGLKNLCQNIQ
jgi:hypothetical protein